MTTQHPNQISLERCIVRKLGKNKTVNKEVAINTDMIISFYRMESICSPACTASIMISDSKDFLNTFPIEGGEEIEFSINHSFSENPLAYTARIYKVSTRIVDGKKQVYTFLMTSEEALINETIKVQDPLDGNPESLTIKLLREKLVTSKEIFSEPSRFKIRMVPGNKRPFDIIAQLIKKAVSPKTNYGQSTTSTESSKSDEQVIKGSAGFLFWETQRGYNLFSVDAICDTSKEQTFAAPKLKSESWGPYVETISNIDTVEDARFNITAFQFQSEIDIMSGLRLGKYSTKMIFFNHSTGAYDEYVYKIKESYDNMAHLGGQSTISLIPGNTDALSESTGRIMSAVLDPETWYDQSEVGDPDDPNVEKPTEYADWTKYYAAQSFARMDLLRNQEGILKIPVNPLICAGDKIDLLLQSKLSDTLKKQKPYDTESSGIYLVKEVTHTFNFVVGGTSGNGFTTLRLFRDSYGTDIEPSKHGNK